MLIVLAIVALGLGFLWYDHHRSIAPKPVVVAPKPDDWNPPDPVFDPFGEAPEPHKHKHHHGHGISHPAAGSDTD